MFNNETLFHIHWVDKMNNTSNKMKISTLEYGNFSESANWHHHVGKQLGIPLEGYWCTYLQSQK